MGLFIDGYRVAIQLQCNSGSQSTDASTDYSNAELYFRLRNTRIRRLWLRCSVDMNVALRNCFVSQATNEVIGSRRIVRNL